MQTNAASLFDYGNILLSSIISINLAKLHTLDTEHSSIIIRTKINVHSRFEFPIDTHIQLKHFHYLYSVNHLHHNTWMFLLLFLPICHCPWSENIGRDVGSQHMVTCAWMRRQIHPGTMLFLSLLELFHIQINFLFQFVTKILLTNIF